MLPLLRKVFHHKFFQKLQPKKVLQNTQSIYILLSSYQSLLVYFQTKNGQPGGAGYLPYKHRTAGLPTSSHIIKCFAFLSLSFVLKHYYDLQFSPAVETIVKKDKKNPKRVLRDVKKQLQNNGIGTKSQQALKLQHELKKEEYKSNSKHKKQMDAEQKFKLKQQKKKAKHRGH